MNHKAPSSEILKRYLSNECTEAEKALVDSWYQSLDLKSGETFSEWDEELLYRKIEEQVFEKNTVSYKRQNSISRLWIYVSGIAAVLLLSLGYIFYTSQTGDIKQLTATIQPVRFSNTQKKTVRYQLPDESIVWLQPGSVIEHPRKFNASTREINFTGEAFFDITRNPEKPFIILTNKLKTQVLGTSFNIQARKNDEKYLVSVVTGSVSVSASDNTNESETVLLKPQQQAVFSTSTSGITLNQIEEKKTDAEPWQPVSLTFDDASLTEITSRLQKTFRVKISLSNPAMKGCVLKVDFDRQNLPEILEMLNTLLGSTYEMEGNHITLSGSGCSEN
jgi:transmembrane sensor